jgi:hypothetical protein
MTWYLTVHTKDGKEHQITLAGDEENAEKELQKASSNIGKEGTVVIADRLTLPAETIASASIHSAY